jgi:FixJ family two-component response regulator
MTTLPPLVAVVEDDSQMLRALARMLNASGYEAACYDSAEAFLTSPPGRVPVCLVLDLRLDGMSGVDLQRRLRALGSTLPIVVLTGTDDPRARAESERLGCAGYLTKDGDGDTLPSLIQSLLPDGTVLDGDSTKRQ